jgi:hypothetical protein
MVKRRWLNGRCLYWQNHFLIHTLKKREREREGGFQKITKKEKGKIKTKKENKNQNKLKILEHNPYAWYSPWLWALSELGLCLAPSRKGPYAAFGRYTTLINPLSIRYIITHTHMCHCEMNDNKLQKNKIKNNIYHNHFKKIVPNLGIILAK